MNETKIMHKIQNNKSRIHYNHKVIILAYCDTKRTLLAINKMFKAVEMPITVRALRYVLQDLISKGFIEKHQILMIYELGIIKLLRIYIKLMRMI